MSVREFQSNHEQESFASELRSIGQEISGMLEHATSVLTHQSTDRTDSLEAALAGQVIGIEIERLQRGLPGHPSHLDEQKAEQALLQLQRLNEEAAAIGRIAQRLMGNAYQHSLLDLAGMAGCVRYMLGPALEALVTGDQELVEMVALTQEQVEVFARQLRERLQSCMDREQESTEWAAAMLSVVRHLESIGGCAVSIAKIACQKETEACL